MNPSIRTFLLINLFLIVTLVTSVALLGDLLLIHKDINKNLDKELIRSNLQLQALIKAYSYHNDFSIAQRGLMSVFKKYNKIVGTYTNTHFSSKATPHTTVPFQFQIWRADKLLLYSDKMGHQKLNRAKNNELITIKLDNIAWRVSILKNSKSKLTFITARPLNLQQQLVSHLTKNAIIIILVTCPFLALLIWLIVGRALELIKKTTQKVNALAPNHIEPLELNFIPIEIKPLIKALNDLFTRLNGAMLKEKRFTADAAHELRTPLAVLKTHTQIALKTDDPQEKEKALLDILAGVDRSTHIVQQLLTLNRITPEAGINDPSIMDLKKTAIEIISQLAPEAINKNIEIELNAQEESYEIYGNPTAIGILMRNLIDNAIRYSPQETNVVILLTKKNKQIYLQVIDNGPGIDPNLRKRVFDRFFRIVGNRAMGSGLGLSIVSQIAKLHHATIQLETGHDDKGLDFTVVFPCPQQNRKN